MLNYFGYTFILFLWKWLIFKISIGKFQRQFYTAAAKSLQLCPTPCDPIDGSPPGSPVPGILQARTLEWVAISFSNAWKWKVKVKSLSHVWLLATPWSAAYQAPPSMGFSRQESWSGVPLPSPSFILELTKIIVINEGGIDLHILVFGKIQKMYNKVLQSLHWIWTTLDKSKSWHNFSKFEEETSSPKSVSPIQISCLNWQDFEVWLNHNRNKEYQHINLVGHSIKARN